MSDAHTKRLRKASLLGHAIGWALCLSAGMAMGMVWQGALTVATGAVLLSLGTHKVVEWMNS